MLILLLLSLASTAGLAGVCLHQRRLVKRARATDILNAALIHEQERKYGSKRTARLLNAAVQQVKQNRITEEVGNVAKEAN